MYPTLQHCVSSFVDQPIRIERQAELAPLIAYIQQQWQQQSPIRLQFICTHNSRRSHFAQIWAQAAAYYYGIPNVQCYSGGTEETALYSTVKDVLMEQGFSIRTLSAGSNPIYAIKYADNEPPILGFSKCYDHHYNPKSGFGAIMTCSQADENCPLIAGAEKRWVIRYEDPKIADGQPHQMEVYWNKSLEIASELFYVFRNVKYHEHEFRSTVSK